MTRHGLLTFAAIALAALSLVSLASASPLQLPRADVGCYVMEWSGVQPAVSYLLIDGHWVRGQRLTQCLRPDIRFVWVDIPVNRTYRQCVYYRVNGQWSAFYRRVFAGQPDGWHWSELDDWYPGLVPL